MASYTGIGLQEGLMNYIAIGFAFLKEILGYLVNLTSGGFQWQVLDDGQIGITGTLPTLTAKGEDIVGALMTIIHNGIVAAAQFATLLPVNMAP
jgi:hypothetical protein